MRRLIVALILLIAVGVAAVWLSFDPGSASFSFRGWMVETSFAALAVFILILGLFIALLWRGLSWLVGLPGAVKRGVARARAQRGYDSLERALIASAAGDGAKARRHATKAGELLDRPLLTRVISARAAEAAGELESAEADYRLLLESPETEIVGLRGLAQAALARGDLAEAQARAGAAFSRSPQARWAYEALFDALVGAYQWKPALVTLVEGEKYGHVPAEIARRRRAVLQTAIAAEAEAAIDYERARDGALAAAQTAPEFPPAAALAARMLLREGQDRKAQRVLEDSWRAAPHPALAALWKDAGDDAAPAPDRAAHKEKLARLAPDHRESRILLAEGALTRGEPDLAEAHLANTPGGRTARLLALLARIAEARGDHDSARRLILESVGAPGEPDWSDVDPTGPAFAWAPEDWARTIYVFGAEARLIHPRHERFQPALIAAPALPLLPRPAAPPPPAPADPEPTLFDRETPPAAPPPAAAPPSPDDPGPYGDPLHDEDPEQTAREFDGQDSVGKAAPLA